MIQYTCYTYRPSSKRDIRCSCWMIYWQNIAFRVQKSINTKLIWLRIYLLVSTDCEVVNSDQDACWNLYSEKNTKKTRYGT